MPLTTTNLTISEEDITAMVHGKVIVTDSTDHYLELGDKLKGGIVVFNDLASIQALKQFLIDAGY